MNKPIILLIFGFLMMALISCSEKEGANPNTDGDGDVKVLATVNGAPITEVDVRQRLKRVVHGETINTEAVQNTLQTLVQYELIYQQSLDLGLDKNQAYRLKLREAEAQFRAFQRQEMSLLYREYVKNRAQVTDSEAKEFFEKNSKRMQSKFHIWQIYYKGEESRIAKDYQDLKSGTSFEKVASRRFPVLPKGMKAPWDLGYLYWNQIPPPWQGSLDRLEPGQVSDIIKGPNERFWVIKLIEKAVDPKITFATEKDKIVDVLKRQKADELYDTMLNQMRTKSKIIFSN